MKTLISNLNKGDIFLLKKNGKPYIYHCWVTEKPENTSDYYEHYILAYSKGKLYAFYTDKYIIKC